MRTHRLAVIDEHELFRRGVLGVLDEDPTIDIVHESGIGPVPGQTDVIITSPGALPTAEVDCPVLVCWGPSDPPPSNQRDRSLAFVERDRVSCDELLAAVRALGAGLRLEQCNGAGRGTLNLRHRHILQLLAEGVDTRGIAESLFYSERSVKGMIRQIEEQLCARNRAQAVAKSIRLGLI
jgi:DNA-binding NarL/FixJ family response regulator